MPAIKPTLRLGQADKPARHAGRVSTPLPAALLRSRLCRRAAGHRPPGSAGLAGLSGRPQGAAHRADPGYALSNEWRTTAEALQQAQAHWAAPDTPSRVLVVCASPRNDGSCPGEMSKTWRLAQLALGVIEDEA